MVTFEYLNLMCQSHSVPPPAVQRLLDDPSPPAGGPFSLGCLETVVQRMPFSFDLLKVLTKCQQAELLLSTFMQDVSPSGLQVPTNEPGGSRDPSSCSHGNQPNILLMSHLLEKMGEAHDREITLRDEDSALFQRVVLQRTRDTELHPVPFIQTKSPVQNTSSFTDATCGDDTLKDGTQGGVKEQPENQQGEEGPPTEQPESREQPTNETAPKWKCFVRSITSTHLMLCFVPASFDDLCALVMPSPEVKVSGDEEPTLVEQSEQEVEGQEGEGAELLEEEVEEQEEKEEEVAEVDQELNPDKDDEENEKPEAESGVEKEKDLPAPESENLLQPQGVEVESVSQPDSEGVDKDLQPEGAEVESEAEGDEVEKDPESVTVSASDPVEKPAVSEPTSLTIPVYVYNCPLSSLTDQMVYRWTHLTPPDIFHDWTMKVETSGGELRNSLTEDAGDGHHRHRTESENIREKIRQSMDDRPEYMSGPQQEFKNHLHLLREYYHRSFVKGMYDSLLHGHNMHSHDVDAVINGICEEALPLEMNITRFLHSTCGHICHLVERAKIEQMMREDNAKMMPKSVEKEESDSLYVEGAGTLHDPSEPIITPGSPRRALDCFSRVERIPIALPLALLNSSSRCEASPTLHALIEKKFSAILGQHFKPVPSNPDFFYYCESDTQSKSSAHDTTGGAFNTSDSRDADVSDVFPSDVDDAGPESDCDFGSVETVSDGEGSNTSDTADSRPIADGQPPLFIHLVCSVRTKGRALKSMAIRNLPSCLGDLKSALGAATESIDLSELQVTVDVICLMLPSDSDLPESSVRPVYQRTTSCSSQVSNLSDSIRPQYEREDTMLSFTGNLTKEVYDSLRCLSNSQLTAVHALKDEVLWLLHDEIASALRLTVPVTVETLNMVTSHVKRSVKKPCCISETVKLQFVYGPDQSLTQFIQSFERIELPGYLLNKEANYYYLLLDHTRANNLAHAKAVSSALHDLYTDSKSFKPETPFTEETKSLITENKPTAPKLTSSLRSNSNNSDSDKYKTGGGPEKTEEKALIAADRSRHSSSDSEKKRATFKINLVDMMNEDRDEPILVQGLQGEPRSEQRSEPKSDSRSEPKSDSRSEPKSDSRSEPKSDSRSEPKSDSRSDSRSEPKSDSRSEPKSDSRSEPKSDPRSEQKSEPRSEECAECVSVEGGQDIKISVIRPSPVKEVTHGFLPPDPEDNQDPKDGGTDQTQTSTPRSLNEARTLHFVGLDSKPNSPGEIPVSDGTSPNLDKTVPKRSASSASLEKFKAGLKSEPGVTSSGPQTPNRSRHQSGLQTPLSGSMFDAASQGSGCEDGYDGGSSDSGEEEEEEIAMSFTESMLRYRQLPDFWLIMEINQGHVDVYFHTRDTDDALLVSLREQKQLFDHVISTIKQMCRTVNQRLLLQDLYNTRVCNQLLVPEADEDVQWSGLDRTTNVNTKHKPQVESDDSDTEATQDRYLEAALHVRPGYFACDCVWRKEFILHPRLKTKDPHRKGIWRGMQVLKNRLVTFAVGNRKNMFVIRESSTGAVFYLRVDEFHAPLRQNSNPSVTGDTSLKDDELSLSVSRSSSVLSLAHRTTRPSETEDEPPMRPVRTSVSDFLALRSLTDSMMTEEDSHASLRQMDTEDSIVLSAYGIGNVGPDISQELVSVLQRCLDGAVLDILVGLYARNPMFKLMPEDVQFIQPMWSSPKQILHLTIPPSALLHQQALSYYLCQNLLQFLHKPRYAEPSPETVFRDYSQAKAPPIEDNHVFLCCTRPQHAGGKGVACIQLTFVDGKGTKIQLINSPKPSSCAYRDQLEAAMFDSLVNTHVYTVNPESKTPVILYDTFPDSGVEGPTALVEFAIWTQGEVDSQLPDRLVLALKHAVCDVIMEYRLLTAPLCDVPAHYGCGIDSPLHSAPQSPVTHFLSGYDQRSHSGSPAEMGKKIQDGGRTPKEKTVFNLPSLFKSKSASKDSPKESPVSPQQWLGTDGQRKRESELRQKIQKYEHGERGILQEVFSRTMPDWLEFSRNIGVPAIQCFQCALISRFPIEYVLREFHNITATLSNDMTLRVFKLAESTSSSASLHDGRPHAYIPYTVSKAGTHSQEKCERSDSWLDLTTCTQLHLPGKASDYIIIGRNMLQWRGCLDTPESEEEAEGNQAPGTWNQKCVQKFLPMEAGVQVTSDKSDCGVFIPTSPAEKTFVPRQKLMLTTITDKKIKVYTYNWVQDSHSSLETQVTKMVAWHNARSQLLTSIISHKAGLIQTTLTCSGDPKTGDGNMFLLGSDLQPLVKYTNPPPMLQHQGRLRNTPVSKSRSAQHNLALLHSIYRDKSPATPMHKSQCSNMRDPIHRHGAQMLDLKHTHKKEEEKNGILRQLYENWQQRMGPSHTPINEGDLELLKNSSRLIHNVATPLLLSPHWRLTVLGVRPASRHDSRASDTPKASRSRHSSGASVRSKRSDSLDSKKRVDSPDITKSPAEEGWHINLRSTFVNQYIQYLQSLGFVQIRTRSVSPKRGSRNLSGDLPLRPQPPDHGPQTIKPNYTYLQKTLPGGIMLLELGFKEVYFCIHVYAFECSRLPIRSINPQLAVIFTDECEKFKDLTHAHSFAHDFHLRTIQSYIMGRLHVFKTNYHLSGFLQDFISFHPYAPTFSRNYILAGVCNLVLKTNNESSQLFRYMLEHDKLYGMRAIRMVPLAEDDMEPENEYALVKQFSGLPEDDAALLKAKPDDYDVGLVITHDSLYRGQESERPTLRLKYYVLLTSRNELFPRHTLERRLGMFKSTSAKQFPANMGMLEGPVNEPKVRGDQEEEEEVVEEPMEVSDPPKMPPVVKYISVGRETTNYLGYSNKHQRAVYTTLLKQAEYAREKIHEMVGSAMSQCRRDLLWQRMLLPGNVTEEEGRRKRRSEHDEGRDPFLTRLSFTEFQELLDIVTRISLRDVDPRLSTLENMNMSWYLGLVKLLRAQYGVRHRHFSSSDGLVQYVIVLNPNFLDTFMMLAVDSLSNKTELSAVYRCRLPEQGHTPANPNLPAYAVQMLMESFITTCFYHMWSGLL